MDEKEKSNIRESDESSTYSDTTKATTDDPNS